MSKHSRYNAARIILIFWTLFIGLGAVGTNDKVLVVYFSRMSKPKRRAAKSLKLKPRKKPTERSDSGGAVGSICIGGICR